MRLFRWPLTSYPVLWYQFLAAWMRLYFSHLSTSHMIVSLFLTLIRYSSSSFCSFPIADSNASNVLIYLTPSSGNFVTSRDFRLLSIIISRTKPSTKRSLRRAQVGKLSRSVFLMASIGQFIMFFIYAAIGWNSSMTRACSRFSSFSNPGFSPSLLLESQYVPY